MASLGKWLERLKRPVGLLVARPAFARARVEHAKILLDDPRLTLRMVAWESGFGSYDALLRAFKQHAGALPSAWRRQAMLRRRGAQDAEKHRQRRPSRTKSTRDP